MRLNSATIEIFFKYKDSHIESVSIETIFMATVANATVTSVAIATVNLATVIIGIVTIAAMDILKNCNIIERSATFRRVRASGLVKLY